MPEQLLFAITKKLGRDLPSSTSAETISLPTFGSANSSSVFKETNTGSADLLEECAARLPDALKLTAAYQTLERSLIELVNNSEQAKATSVTVACHIDRDKNKIRFVIHDNGHGLKPAYITERYDWAAALQKRSTQASAEETTVKKASGQHLGISTAAYLVERAGGNLALKNNPNGTGARITVTSPLTPCDTVLFDQPSGDDALKVNEIAPGNIVEEMLHQAIKKQPDDASKLEMLKNIETNSASKTLRNAVKAVKTRLGASPMGASPISGGSYSGSFSSPFTPSSTSMRKRPAGLSPLTAPESVINTPGTVVGAPGMFSVPPSMEELRKKKAEAAEKKPTSPKKS